MQHESPPEETTVRCVLDEQAFGRLVAGQVAAIKGRTSGGTVAVEIILSDIGWTQMLAAIDRARAK